jgi:ABC-type glycerol-3-phosphate transport system substrate-binding protein
MRAVSLLLSVVTLVAVACSHSTTSPTTTSATTTTTTTTTAAPATTETFSGTLGVGATTFDPFTVAQTGTVTATLVSIGGDEVPSTVQVRLGIGTEDDIGCNATTTLIVSSKSPVLTTTETAGAYCANITDVGNLFAAATFSVTITHP